MWIRENGVGITPARRLTSQKRGVVDRKRYCQYHRDYGHNTDSYRDLARAIEQLIKNGKLGDFIRNRDSNDQTTDSPTIKKARNEVVGVINMIIGGETPADKK